MTLNSIPSLIGIRTDESVPPPNLHSTQNTISPCIVSNLPLLGIPPTRGEPARPRGAQAPLRRRRVYPHRAACKPRNRNRGFRSKSRTEGRKKERVERTKYKRRLFRQFKQFMLQYSFKQKALEMRKRSSTWRLFGKPERRRQFHHFSKREKEQKTEDAPNMAYGKEIKVASLNVRGLKGEQAHIKQKLLIDIMKKNAYDVLLLQETTVNRNCVQHLDGFKFFFSTDVKEQEVANTQRRLDEAIAKGEGRASVQRTDIERAGVGIVLSKHMKHFLADVQQVNGRIMSIKLRSKGRNLRFVSCDAPHSGYSTDDKIDFWETLSNIASKTREVLYIGGDMNARLHHRFQAEEHVLGPHIFGRGLSYLRNISDATLENRSLFLQFCEKSDLRVMNTFFRKSLKGYCTFRENTTEHGAEWTPTRYAQLDFWLVGEKWAKSCKDVTARPDIHFPSDHYIVESTIRIKLPGFKENPRPTTQEWNNYNQQLKEQLGDVIDPNRDLDSWDNFAEIIFRTACNTLSQITPRQKRNYISRRTWNLIEQRQCAHEAENHQVVKELTRQI